MKETYTKKEVAEITGIPYRNVQFYTEQGVVTPEIDPGEGRGRFRRYSPRDLVSFIVAGELGYYGMTVSEIKRTIQVIKHFWGLKVDLPDKNGQKNGSDILATLSKILVTLRVGKTRDKTKVTVLNFGTDAEGKPLIVLSMIKPAEGELKLQLLNNQKDEGPYIVTMNERHKQIKDYDLAEILKDDLVSFVFISIDELIAETLKRIP